MTQALNRLYICTHETTIAQEGPANREFNLSVMTTKKTTKKAAARQKQSIGNMDISISKP